MWLFPSFYWFFWILNARIMDILLFNVKIYFYMLRVDFAALYSSQVKWRILKLKRKCISVLILLYPTVNFQLYVNQLLIFKKYNLWTKSQTQSEPMKVSVMKRKWRIIIMTTLVKMCENEKSFNRTDERHCTLRSISFIYFDIFRFRYVKWKGAHFFIHTEHIHI